MNTTTINLIRRDFVNYTNLYNDIKSQNYEHESFGAILNCLKFYIQECRFLLVSYFIHYSKNENIVDIIKEINMDVNSQELAIGLYESLREDFCGYKDSEDGLFLLQVDPLVGLLMNKTANLIFDFFTVLEVTIQELCIELKKNETKEISEYRNLKIENLKYEEVVKILKDIELTTNTKKALQKELFNKNYNSSFRNNLKYIYEFLDLKFSECNDSFICLMHLRNSNHSNGKMSSDYTYKSFSCKELVMVKEKSIRLQDSLVLPILFADCIFQLNILISKLKSIKPL
jgi:hypothetical protein